MKPALPLALALLACGAAPLPRAERLAQPECARGFAEYDRLERAEGAIARIASPTPYRAEQQGREARSEAIDLLARGCLLYPQEVPEVVALLSGRVAPNDLYQAGGASFQLAVVAGDAGARTLALAFQAAGYRARTVGLPSLGRRVVTGPVSGPGAAHLGELARELGLGRPIPVRF